MQLTRLLARDGRFDVRLACLNDEGVLRKEVEEIGFTDIPEFCLTSFFNVNFLRQVRNCAKFITENKIDVVHTHDFYTNIFGMAAARLARVKVRLASKRETGSMRSAKQKLIEKQAFRAARGIVVNAEAVKNYLIGEGVAAGKIQTIYNGLDLERLRPADLTRAEIREMLGLPANKRFITLVANLRHEVKNQPMFLRAAQGVSEKIEDAGFVLAGEGQLMEGLKSLAQELGILSKCFFIGRCERVAELLSVSEIGVLSSFNEGFSNSILEYMAAGLPVVATDVGGAREAVVENETGFLVASDDDRAMTEKLIGLLENPKKAAEMGARGRLRIEENFSCAAQLENTITLYRRLLDGR